MIDFLYFYAISNLFLQINRQTFEYLHNHAYTLHLSQHYIINTARKLHFGTTYKQRRHNQTL